MRRINFALQGNKNPFLQSGSFYTQNSFYSEINPPPPIGSFIDSENGKDIITEDSKNLITEV
jgi:hypothetical protein